MRLTKADIVKEVEKLGLDVDTLRAAMADPAHTASAESMALKFLADHSELLSELHSAASDAAVRDLKRRPGYYQPVPDDMAEKLMESMVDPVKIWTSEGTFVIDVSLIGDRDFEAKRVDVQQRLNDRTYAFQVDLNTLR